MAIFLGVDTGGTYTDAVLLQDEEKVLASAKALTTRHNLALGVGAAIDAVLAQSGLGPSEIALASLSTTLATNALVEGQGGRVALIFIGFTPADLRRQGLEQSLNGDPVVFLAGGHSHAGAESAAFDASVLREQLQQVDAGVSAYAVASQFATRNPAHEVAAREIIREITAKPVSCSHDLTSKLNGPKRAMTAVLNARLIGMIDHLIGSSEDLLHNRGIDAPLMVVRGDGALISAEMARDRPIETILSGPAASIVGARWLTDEKDALVSDIGGTTTDVAVLRDGRPMIDPMGARVGKFRTMVEAVAMRTTGLGGDSEIHMAQEGLSRALTLGPRRVLPVSLCATEWPDLVHSTLDRCLQSERANENDGRFVVPILQPGQETAGSAGLSTRELRMVQTIGDQARELSAILTNRLDLTAISRLVSRGLVMISAVTPSDAAHVVGGLDVWDQDAASKALQLFGRQRTGAGVTLCPDAQSMAHMVIEHLTEQTALTLMESAFAEDGYDFGHPAGELARHILTRKGMDQHRGILALNAGLNLPVIGLGASAVQYYPAVGQRLNTKMLLPEYGGVANALGAVVGQITMRATGHISAPGEDRFRVHFTDGPQDFTDCDQAMAALEDVLRQQAHGEALKAGSQNIHLSVARNIQTTKLEGREVFIEADITVTASGRPRIATE